LRKSGAVRFQRMIALYSDIFRGNSLMLKVERAKLRCSRQSAEILSRRLDSYGISTRARYTRLRSPELESWNCDWTAEFVTVPRVAQFAKLLLPSME